eukprot:6213824-Pleurochrysis_carterae.AAC.2
MRIYGALALRSPNSWTRSRWPRPLPAERPLLEPPPRRAPAAPAPAPAPRPVIVGISTNNHFAARPGRLL